MSGNSSYGPVNCEVALNFDTCIQNAGGSLDPKAWTACSVLQSSDMTKYNECVYNGYKSIVQCFESFCNNDTSNTVSTMKAARDQFEGIVNSAQQSQQQQTQPQQQQQPQQQTPGQSTEQTNQPTGQTNQNTGATTQPITQTKNDDMDSGASSNKVAKVLVSFLAISALAMNFL
ncbi:hypothetical protein BCR36DRAFT_582306 [Piromyces finnis]|uniref:Uncharacterized protein n=1 Tax=Piromyces finnis TaxID=1754191 RepID=A0A1Y1VDP5_9FUNG|nr:hypothetical protein BCR36DRAFT_582306 [Piromyces finnis]|eukprot:ORX52894.1 hypothetical protein BCR36DRAFT_582306 [Piromyces finnis]